MKKTINKTGVKLCALLLALLCVCMGCTRGRGGREDAANTEVSISMPTDCIDTEHPDAAGSEAAPTAYDTEAATDDVTAEPTGEHTAEPTDALTDAPTAEPTPTHTVAPTAAPTAFPTAAPTQTPTTSQIINAKLASMTVEEKIGQLLMFGFNGSAAPDEAFVQTLRNYHVGNMILFGDNINKNDGTGGFSGVKQLLSLIERTYPAPVPRFYSVDVEGGNVVRFNWQPALKSAYQLGQGSVDEAYAQYYRIGQQLRSYGVNMDLAPVLDVAPDPLSTFMGTRIFSSDPQVVCTFGSAAVRGLHAGRCLACAKHFPGHGGTAEDSHDHTPIVNKTAEELYAYDLVPFRYAVQNGIDCVMAAHIKYPALDETDVASMSHRILTGILRQEFGFNGIIISDEITMGGLASQHTPGESAVKFIQAGGDIILCGANYQAQAQVIQALYEAVHNGTITTQRIDQSVYRILAYKYSYGILTP